MPKTIDVAVQQIQKELSEAGEEEREKLRMKCEVLQIFQKYDIIIFFLVKEKSAKKLHGITMYNQHHPLHG